MRRTLLSRAGLALCGLLLCIAVRADGALVVQVFMNLLENVAKRAFLRWHRDMHLTIKIEGLTKGNMAALRMQQASEKPQYRRLP